MEQLLTALLPIFLLILLGYGFKFIKFPSEDFWSSADKFTYYVLFPSLLFYKVSTANLNNIDGFKFVGAALLSVLVLTIFLMFFNKVVTFSGKSFTSIYQGAVRYNTYVFLALVDAIFGSNGLALAAFLMAFLIPSLNIFSITIFAIYTSTSKISFVSVAKSIIKNPLIIACAIGGAVNIFDINLGNSFLQTLSLLSSAALPLGLLSVGVGLHLSSIKETKLGLFVSTISKLIILPIVMYIIASIFGVSGLPLQILIIFASIPTASSAYILAQQLGGDTKLMSSIITLQTLVSVFTMAIVMQIFVK